MGLHAMKIQCILFQYAGGNCKIHLGKIKLFKEICSMINVSRFQYIAASVSAATLFLFSPPGSAATINVPNEYPTIQTAINAAVSGDVIRVSAGIYYESDITFHGKDLVLESISGPAETIVDGTHSNRVFHLYGNLTRAAVVDGFTIRNGLDFNPGGGGGMRIINGSPTIRNNIFEKNSTITGGGGMRVTFDANPLIINNIFQDNTAPSGRGGGLSVEVATAEIIGNTFLRNKAFGISASSGGAIRILDTTAKALISNNVMKFNTSTFTGGALNAIASDIELIDNVIVGNESDQGGGVHLEISSGDFTWIIRNNEIRENIGIFGAGGLNLFAGQGKVNLIVEDNKIIANQAESEFCTTGAEAECGQGGGIRASQGTGTESYTGNLIQGNMADTYAGALLLGVAAKSVIFYANRIESNNSRFKYPGVSCVGVTDCTIARNEFLLNENVPIPITGVVPGALYLKNTLIATVENNYFYGNKGHEAGALYATESAGSSMNVLIRNNSFVDNMTIVPARGTLYFRGQLSSNIAVTLVNNIIQGDIRGIYVRNNPVLDIRYNDFHGYTLGVFKSGTETIDTVPLLNATSFASDNINIDPGFSMVGDVHLAENSALLGAASCVDAPSVDIDNEARPPIECDIGADEFTCIVTTVSGVVTASPTATYEACETLKVGPSFTAENGASVFLSSGLSIIITPNFSVKQGAILSAEVCGQSLCETGSLSMPDGCHSCVVQICNPSNPQGRPGCCSSEWDALCVEKVESVCDLKCE
jgi:hypothetical protein